MNYAVVPVPDMSVLDSRSRARLAELEREFCSEQFGEYLRCTNTRCGFVLSKTDVFANVHDENSTLQELEDSFDATTQLLCSNCSSKLSHFWSSQEILNLMERRHRENSWGALMVDPDGKIQGFAEAYLDRLENIWGWEFEDTYGDQLLPVVSNVLKARTGSPNPPIVMWPVVGVSKPRRSLSVLFKLLDTLYAVMPTSTHSLIMLADTMQGSTIHRIQMCIGAEILTRHSRQERRNILMRRQELVPAAAFKNTRAFIRQNAPNPEWRR